jgi:hypothetical protein
MANQVGFTLGENIGQLLHNMSWENLMDYNPEKAVSLWVESFGGCTEDMAGKLVTGQMICSKDPEDPCGVLVNDRGKYKPEDLEGYPSFDWNDIHQHILWDISISEPRSDRLRAMTDWQTTISRAKTYIEFDSLISVRYEVRYILGGMIEDKYNYEYIGMRKILNWYFEHNYELPEDFAVDGRGSKLAIVLVVINYCHKIIRNYVRIMDTIKFVMKNFPMTDDEMGEWRHFGYTMDDLLAETKEFLDYAMTLSKTKVSVKNDMLNEFLENDAKISKELDDFKPRNILDNYDAGMLAPDGTFFGLNGTTANLLHITLADAIMEYYGWTKPDDYCFGTDFWLLRDKGFVKITKDWILYEGYETIIRKKPVELTSAQRKAIIEYGNKCHNGKLLFGYDKKPCGVDVFEKIEDEVHMSQLFGTY